MTMVPVKDRLKNIINLPQNLPAKLIRTLTQDASERSWEDVLELQKATWKVPDNHSRRVLDEAVQKSYDVRYGDNPARQDVTGRLINEEREWNPKKGIGSDKLGQVGLKLRQLMPIEIPENIFRGVEYGLNILRRKDEKALKVCGVFDNQAQDLFGKVLQRNSASEILSAFKRGLITDCVLSYQNRDLNGNDKKSKVAKIVNVFDTKDQEEDDFAYGEDELEAMIEKTLEMETGGEVGSNPVLEKQEKLPEDIEGFLWESQDSCQECQAYNGQFFTLEELPEAHPNCRCTIEVVFKNYLEKGKAEEKEGLDVEEKKRNEIIFRRNIKDLEYFEGKISHIYLDSDGNITTGTGTYLEDKQVFRKVKFQDDEGRFLTDKEKDALYDKIQKDKEAIISYKKKGADYYKGKWDVSIGDKERQNLVKEHVESDLVALRKMCEKYGKDFDKLPPSQQDALLDLRYNMGGNFNDDKWPDFFEAFDIDNYDIQSKESHRKSPISEERNDWVQDKFEQAKIEAQKKEVTIDN